VNPHSADRRQLGLKLHRLALDTPDGLQEVALTSPALRAGFNELERDADGWMWRWTTGDALLDLGDLIQPGAVAALEIGYDQALPMWVEPAAEAVDNVVLLRATG
jgi:hypothetical protein